jgi:hypothetical protein
MHGFSPIHAFTTTTTTTKEGKEKETLPCSSEQGQANVQNQPDFSFRFLSCETKPCITRVRNSFTFSFPLVSKKPKDHNYEFLFVLSFFSLLHDVS